VVTVNGVPDAVLERVPDDAAPPEVRGGRPEPVPARPQVVVQVEEADAGLDAGHRVLLVDLEHPVHPAQAHEDRPRHPRRRAAVRVVASLGDDPQRESVTAREPENSLNISNRLREHCRRDPTTVPPGERERIAVLAARGILVQHRGRAEQRDEIGAGRGGQAGSSTPLGRRHRAALSVAVGRASEVLRPLSCCETVRGAWDVVKSPLPPERFP
jgi:hypothetical protein